MTDHICFKKQSVAVAFGGKLTVVPTVWLRSATDDARLIPGGETTGIIDGNKVVGNGLGDETT